MQTVGPCPRARKEPGAGEDYWAARSGAHLLPFGFQTWNMAHFASVPLDTPMGLPSTAVWRRPARRGAATDMETVKAAMSVVGGWVRSKQGSRRSAELFAG